MSHHKRTTCRICGLEQLHCFLELGPSPLANSFLRSADEFVPECAYPLDVCFCNHCSLVQISDVIDPEVLFRNYVYVSGTSETIEKHFRAFATQVVQRLDMNAKDLVVEVASNDGTLLKAFQSHGVRTLGIEPARNIAQIARQAGVGTLDLFFDKAVANQIRSERGSARAVVGNNVLAHVDDTVGFFSGFKELLANNGLAVVEVPYLGDLLERTEYDTIYHEHLCYFSVTTLLRLCQTVGLSLVRVDHVPVHGGSLRIYAGLPEQWGDHAQGVLDWVERERSQGMSDVKRFVRLASDAAANRTALRDLLMSLRREGKTVAGYGAPAKGNTLLNYCGIDTNLLEYTVDKNPLKVGTFTPGMHIPVLPPSTLVERQPDYVLILAWNFAEEIMRQQATYRDRGGKFVVPVPEPRVIE